MANWIKISERIPTPSTRVFMWGTVDPDQPEAAAYEGYFNETGDFVAVTLSGYETCLATHWYPAKGPEA